MRPFVLLFISLLGLLGHPQPVTPTDTPDSYKLPADFPWDSFEEYPPCLYMSKGDSAVLSVDRTSTVNETELIALPVLLAFAWQGVKITATATTTVATIAGCVQNFKDPSVGGTFGCIGGLAATILAVGAQKSAIKTAAKTVKGWFERPENIFGSSGLVNIDLTVFSKVKRDFVDDASREAQHMHNTLVYLSIRELAPDVEFLGYAHGSHRLSVRDSGVHPYASVFRFSHSGLPAMDIVSRDLGEEGGGMHFTIAYADHPTHIKRTSYFRHDRLSSHLMEARFSEAASESDTYDITFSASGSFSRLANDIGCFSGNYWNRGHVLNAQFYDKTHKATFAFGSVGIFPDTSINSQFENFVPTGQPLTGGANCPGQ